jgi:hypothetical protein
MASVEQAENGAAACSGEIFQLFFMATVEFPPDSFYLIIFNARLPNSNQTRIEMKIEEKRF